MVIKLGETNQILKCIERMGMGCSWDQRVCRSFFSEANLVTNHSHSKHLSLARENEAVYFDDIDQAHVQLCVVSAGNSSGSGSLVKDSI
mmetsp:Transcript_31520/g.59269  ORF Transcript_31520/g.59269 Transcript_31520/m.59269 type:complete len:89 (+) Transcript_31520:1858-2124(+)